MSDKLMESIVNCPACGERVGVMMEPYQEAIIGLMGVLDEMAGLEKTTHFQGQSKCKCGKLVVASLHVTAGE